MRIAIASDDGQQIAAHTGCCRGFEVFEITDGRATHVESRQNAAGSCASGHRHGNAGSLSSHAGPGQQHRHDSIRAVIGDCCALVTRGLGPPLARDLAGIGIDTYVCRAKSVDQAADLFAAGRLERVIGHGQCTHNHGSSSVSGP